MTEPPRPTPPPKSAAVGTTATTAVKPKLRHPYRPHPPSSRNRRQTYLRRCLCCTTLFILCLCLLLLAAMAGLYLFYTPQRPVFSLASFSTAKLKLSTANHLSTTFSLTVISRNPNSHSVTFLYDLFTVSVSQEKYDIFLGNGTIPEFTSSPKDRTSLRATVSAESLAVDDNSVDSLTAEMKAASGVTAKVMLDTKVKMKAGFLESSKVPVRVTCEGIKGVVAPAKKANSGATTAVIGKSGCKVDVRIKIWKFTF